MNYTKITLGELLSSVNETIKRNAVSILKQLQKPAMHEEIKRGGCPQCGANSKVVHFKTDSHTRLISEKCTECDYFWERK